MRTALLLLALYLLLEPKKREPRGDVFIEGGPSNPSDWENPYWRDWQPGDPTP